MKGYAYSRPLTAKPPARNSTLGMLVMACDYANFLTAREIFKRGFRPDANYESFKQAIGTATRRSPPLLEKRFWENRRPNFYRLTEEGRSLKQTYQMQMALRHGG